MTKLTEAETTNLRQAADKIGYIDPVEWVGLGLGLGPDGAKAILAYAPNQVLPAMIAALVPDEHRGAFFALPSPMKFRGEALAHARKVVADAKTVELAIQEKNEKQAPPEPTATKEMEVCICAIPCGYEHTCARRRQCVIASGLPEDRVVFVPDIRLGMGQDLQHFIQCRSYAGKDKT